MARLQPACSGGILNRNHPLLERLRFLSASNLDEFYMVRVAGLKAQVRAGVTTKSDDNLTRPAVGRRQPTGDRADRDQQNGWRTLRQELPSGRHHRGRSQRTDRYRDRLAGSPLPRRYLPDPHPSRSIRPPVPLHPNLGFSLALQLYNPDRSQNLDALPMPCRRQAIHPAAGIECPSSCCWSSLSCYSSTALFPAPFKLTGHGVSLLHRDSEMEIDEEAEDLVRTFESALKRRRRGERDSACGQYRYGARPAGIPP